jgi:hypothetical protein
MLLLKPIMPGQKKKSQDLNDLCDKLESIEMN